MFEKTSYDQIYDEHIFMFSVTSVKKIFNLYNFELINIVPKNTWINEICNSRKVFIKLIKVTK